MGRLSYEPYIQHWSHPHHVLELELLTSPSTSSCSGCKLQSSGWIYTCKPCNFTLHVSCTQMPQLINHPSHPTHSLNLISKPLYPGGYFNCDGCGHNGYGFSYHCSHCDFDLHILCASKPLFITHHQSHPHHPLNLTFHPPYQTKGFSCDICLKLGFSNWLYRCSACEFDAHLDCATKQPQVQSQQQNNTQLNHYNGNANVSLQNNNQVQPTNGLMGMPIQGFVDGAAQQVGQNCVQNIVNAATQDSSSSPGFGIGSSIFSGVFGGNSEDQ